MMFENVPTSCPAIEIFKVYPFVLAKGYTSFGQRPQRLYSNTYYIRNIAINLAQGPAVKAPILGDGAEFSGRLERAFLGVAALILCVSGLQRPTPGRAFMPVHPLEHLI